MLTQKVVKTTEKKLDLLAAAHRPEGPRTYGRIVVAIGNWEMGIE